ncbi:hypothetical protein BC833DRAFT_198444 [Globomyces pollinis-pini]|nr:hypothetical protein BC833DRAFT_198444 [Globomyces pollinis-pini]
MSLKTSLNTFIADQRLTHDESTNPKSDQLGKVEQLQPEDSLKFSNVKTVNDDFNSPEDDFITEDSQKFKTNSTEFRYHAPYEKTNSYSLRKSTTDQSINSGVNSEGHFRRSKTTQRENENTLTRLLSKHTSTSEMDPFKTKLDDTNGMRRSSTTHRANSIRSNSSLSRMNSARDKSSMKLPSNMDDTLSRQRSRLIEGSLPIIVDPAPDLEPFVMSTSVLNDTIEESEVKSTFEISNEREHIKLLIEKSMEGREIEEVGEEEEEDGKFEKNAIQGSIQEEESGQIEEEIPYRRSIRIMPDTIQEGSDENIPGEFGVTDTENSKQLASIMESIIPRNNSNLSEIIVEKGPIAKTDMIPKMESWAKENSISSTNAHVSQSQLSSSETQIVDTSLFSKTVGQPKNFNSTNQNLSDSLQETFL